MRELENIINLQKRLVPELVDLVQERYHILRYIRYHQPIGRRVLAGQMELSESSIRNGVKILKDSELIALSGIGMSVTQAGQDVIDQLHSYMDALSGLAELELYLKEELGVHLVKIVPGDSRADLEVFQELGRVASDVLAGIATDGMVIAVSGGSTMAVVAGSVDWKLKESLIVPTRGGLGSKLERQANNVAAVMAENLGGRYKLLHIPEILNDEALEALKATDQSITEIELLIKSANVLIHGVGRADTMARRRNHAPEIREEICRDGAGETLGHYFDLRGNCIYAYCANGFRLNDLVDIGRKIAVAGGKDKAEAIIAVTRAGSKDVLIIDEAAAGAIQSIIKSEKSQRTF